MEKMLSELDAVDTNKAALDKATVMFRGASVVLNIQRLEMKYAQMHGRSVTLPFMEGAEVDDGA